MTIRTGRNRELDPFQPGQASIVLDSYDRQFDPNHSAGPYYGNLLPEKRLRVQATASGTTYDVFTGFVDDWPQDYQPPASALARITATDGLKRLARSHPAWDVYAQEVRTDTPRAWWRMSDKSGTTFTDWSGNGYDLLCRDTNVESVSAASLIASDNGAARLPVAAMLSAPNASPASATSAYSVEFWIQIDPAAVLTVGGVPNSCPYLICNYGPPGSVVNSGNFNVYLNPNGATALSGVAGSIGFDIGVTTGAPWNICGRRNVMDGLIHHVVVTKSGSTQLLYIDGKLESVASASGGTGFTNVAGVAVNVNQGASIGYPPWDRPPVIDEIAIYDGVALSASRILAHYLAGKYPWDGDRSDTRIGRILDLAGWPSGDRSIDTGIGYLGPATWTSSQSALDIIDEIERTELGAVFIDHSNGGKVRFRRRTALVSDTRSATSQVTLSDDPADSTAKRYESIQGSFAYSTIINSVTVKWVGGEYTATDSTSISTNGEKSITVDTVLPRQSDAVYYASGLLNRYKTAITKFGSVTLNPGADHTLFPEVLSRKIGDRVTVRLLPQNTGSAITLDCIVEGIDHDIGAGQGDWKTTYWLSRAETTNYWRLGTGQLGSTAILAF